MPSSLNAGSVAQFRDNGGVVRPGNDHRGELADLQVVIDDDMVQRDERRQRRAFRPGGPEASSCCLRRVRQPSGQQLEELPMVKAGIEIAEQYRRHGADEPVPLLDLVTPPREYNPPPVATLSTSRTL